MTNFWLDSNVFIEGKKGPYGFDIAPRFWTLIDELIEDRRIACPIQVHQELLDGQDEITTWAKEHRNSGLFVDPSISVQEAFRAVVDYVVRHYPDNQARRRFLRRADPWVIAHALAEGGIAVTLEPRAGPTSRQVKIPNVCDGLGVECLNTYGMLRQLGVSWND